MCGIAGHVDFARAPLEHSVRNLTRRIRHRGPDDDGLWVSPARECVLGHARLSVIDLSPYAHQPMVDPETGNCIVFNGEIYNFQSLRRECERLGDVFRSESDTEVVLALYRRLGVACVKKMRGMFALALWDERSKRLVLMRDRVGKKPLNYAILNGGIVFCSAIDPLAKYPDVSPEIDSEALELFLQFQYIPAPWTIYRNVRKLPPAHIAVFEQNVLTVEKYWDIDYRTKLRLSENEAIDGLEERLIEATRLRMIADVPLGALLSGGVDSSLVVALMTKVSRTPVRTFSIGFREDKYDESEYARYASRVCDTIHHEEVIEGDVERLMPKMAVHYGEPFADSSAIASFLLCESARRHVTVAMNGDGGDELLGGYPRYQLSSVAVWCAPLFSRAISAEYALDAVVRVVRANKAMLRLWRRALTKYLRPEVQAAIIHGVPWNDAELEELLGAARTISSGREWQCYWLKNASRWANNPIDRMLWYDNHTYLPGDLLVKMDVASMHCGLETRSPLLDHEVIEYCAALPVSYKTKNGVGKYLLKRLAERHFGKSFVYRRKMGFAIPLVGWLRGPLRRDVEITLRNPDAMAPLSHGTVIRCLDEFLLGKSEHAARVWTLYIFGTWNMHARTNS